jgi:hypothetical protein
MKNMHALEKILKLRKPKDRFFPEIDSDIL